VGLTEELARVQGPQVTVNRLALERVDRAQTIGETESFIKIVASPSGRVLGATIASSGAPAHRRCRSRAGGRCWR
jgi:pyruvate/2-oxoglutarate dehydrogenase complex dihydrolipoamide dehydrogenase (E3) component